MCTPPQVENMINQRLHAVIIGDVSSTINCQMDVDGKNVTLDKDLWLCFSGPRGMVCCVPACLVYVVYPEIYISIIK